MEKLKIMATIKSYTDLEQSKKLAKILPLESADMIYPSDFDFPFVWIEKPKKDKNAIPCWSLAALLDILPTLDDRNANFCKDVRYDKWHVYYHSTATLSIIDTERYDNLVDAAVELIMKLHELKLWQ